VAGNEDRLAKNHFFVFILCIIYKQRVKILTTVVELTILRRESGFETPYDQTELKFSVELSWIEISSLIGRLKGDYKAYLSFICPLRAYFMKAVLVNWSDCVQLNNWKVL
jgi:hypothetical protein